MGFRFIDKTLTRPGLASNFKKKTHTRPYSLSSRVKSDPLGSGWAGYPRVGSKLPSLVKFKECKERLIRINYDHNKTVGFRERRGQNLVKVGQTQSNLIDAPENIRLCEIRIQILIIRIEKYGDILVLVKFENNWIVR